MNRVLDECDKAAFLFINEDEENVAQMRYLNKFLSEMDSTKSMSGSFELIKVSYDNECEPMWHYGAMNVDCIVNVYPKEWMITEITQDGLVKYDFRKLRSFEPFWKLILGNKAILPLLWSMYPNHPNLLPAYFDDPSNVQDWTLEHVLNTEWVSKPLFGREGLGVFESKNFSTFSEFVNTTEYNFGLDNITNEKLGKSIY